MKLSFRQKTDVLAVLMFLLAVSFTIFMGFQRMRSETWAVLFWIVMLFMGVSSIVSSLRTFSGDQKYFFFQLTDPISLYLSRLLYEFVWLCLYGFILYGVFSLFFGNAVPFSGSFVLTLVAGCFSLASVFTFVSALIGSTGKGSTMATLLGFPLLLPVILLMIRLFYQLMGLVDDQTFMTNWASLIGVDVLLLGAGLILFPLIWRS